MAIKNVSKYTSISVECKDTLDYILGSLIALPTANFFEVQKLL